MIWAYLALVWVYYSRRLFLFTVRQSGVLRSDLDLDCIQTNDCLEQQTANRIVWVGTLRGKNGCLRRLTEVAVLDQLEGQDIVGILQPSLSRTGQPEPGVWTIIYRPSVIQKQYCGSGFDCKYYKSPNSDIVEATVVPPTIVSLALWSGEICRWDDNLLYKLF